MRHIICSLILLFNSLNAYAEIAIQPFVVGGVDSSTLEVPWQVFVVIDAGNVNYACGGSIIANNWVITAAHCLNTNEDRAQYNQAQVQAIKVYSGSGNIGNLNLLDQYSLSSVIIHPNYQHAEIEKDIALLKLSTPIRQPAAAIATLTADQQVDLDNEFATGVTNNLILTGWGKTSVDRISRTQILQKVELNGVSDASCIARWNFFGRQNFETHYLCADAVNRGACSGDSGGPLVWQDKSRASDLDKGYRLVGVVSFGSALQCADNNLPDVYTQISSYQGWINASIANYVQPQSNFLFDIFENDFIAASNNSDKKSGGSFGILSLIYLLCVYKRKLNHK